MEILFRMQKRAIRTITMSSYRSHSIPLFRECRLLTLQEIHAYKIILFMFKVYHKIAPETFHARIIKNNEIHNYGTRYSHELRVPPYKLSIMKQLWCVKGVYMWNFVCKYITHDCSQNSFKISLRRFIIGNNDIPNIVP